MTDFSNPYTCSCDAGWDGDYCDNNIDECASNPCVNGSCVDGIADYTCSCDAGWEGKDCDTLTAKALSLTNPRFGDGQSLNADFPPEKAIDGSVSTGMAHSLNNQNPTFLVDLPNSQAIVERVIIYPRRECCFEKYSQLKVKIYYNNQHDGTTQSNYCEAAQSLDENTIKSMVDGAGIVFQCNSSVRGATIIVENTNYPLHFTEIEAFGFEALPLSRPRFDDGKFLMYSAAAGYSPEQAIDGIVVSGNMAHSATEQYPTFRLDLPWRIYSQTMVGKLIIYPRQDKNERNTYHKYSQMKVSIDDNYCETDQSLDENTIRSLVNGGAGIVFQCNVINGSTIIVQQDENNYLHLSEIEAFGLGVF